MKNYNYDGKEIVTRALNLTKFICIVVLIVLAAMGAGTITDDTGTFLVIVAGVFMLIPRRFFHWIMWIGDDK